MKIKVTSLKLQVFLKGKPKQSAKMIAEAFGVTPPTLWKVLVPGVQAGWITVEKKGKVPFYSLAAHFSHFSVQKAAWKYDVNPMTDPKFISMTDPKFIAMTPLPVIENKNHSWVPLTQATLLYYIAHTGTVGWGWTSLGLAKALHVTPPTVWKVLVPALKKGYLEKVQVGKKRYYKLTKVGISWLEAQKVGISWLEAQVVDVPSKLMNVVSPGAYDVGSLTQKDIDNTIKQIHDHWPTQSVDALKYFKTKPKPLVAWHEKNCGGATDVKLGEPDYLKQKEYGYKVVVSVNLFEGPIPVAYNHHYAGFSVEKKAAISDWDLNPMLNLNVECADFYALYDLSLDFVDVEAQFRVKRDMLTAQFAHYIDMAVGGEFRHAAHRVDNKEALMKKAPLIKLVMNGKLPAERSAAWRSWKKIRGEQGLDALRQVEYVYMKGHWRGSFGGLKWGKGAETLRMFLEGDLTPTIFVDTVWSLQHNNGFILNKVWSCQGLDPILNAKFAGTIEDVVIHASEEVRKLWKEKKCGKV